MLAPFADLLTDARAEGRAVGGFTAYDLSTGAAIIRAASESGVGVIVIVSAQAFAAPTGNSLLSGLSRLGGDAPVPVCLQLDHVSDLAAMKLALEAGAGSVMADGSKLDYAENLGLVRDAVDLADSHGAGVEAELGRIEGDEEYARDTVATGLTDPEQAVEFVTETAAQCLAVSIGNVHGSYRAPPRLDWPRLGEIASRVSVPLSLHGASGLADDDVRRSVGHGVAKVNVNTELRQRWFELIGERAGTLSEGSRLLALQAELESAIAEVVRGKLAILRG